MEFCGGDNGSVFLTVGRYDAFLNIYMRAIFVREHKHLFTFYVIPLTLIRHM